MPIFLILFLFSSLVSAQSLTSGRYLVGTGEYKFAPQVHSDILSDRKTEIWARVFWPEEATTNEVPADRPLVVFLHGNHGTCGIGIEPRLDDLEDYTDLGSCPSGYVVTPNHEGYNYIARELASQGYIVFSINANRGITGGASIVGDSGLNLARGRLILKHLEYWSQWNQKGNAPLSLKQNPKLFLNKINFSFIGMMGHSRGGEGVRAAYNLYRDTGSLWPAKIPHMKIEAIFEIGAVDGQTDRILDAPGVIWNQLIPICDGDVSSFYGIRPFHRMLQSTDPLLNGQKSVLLVYGANHNFFNTEWQENDSTGCVGHKALWSDGDWKSTDQQAIGQKVIVDFFRNHLKPTFTYRMKDVLNPVHSISGSLSSLTRIERDFSCNPRADVQLRFDDFNSASNIQRSTLGSLVTSLSAGNLALKSQLKLTWNKNINLDPAVLLLSSPKTIDISSMKTLDIRYSLAGAAQLSEPLNFLISLVDEDGKKSRREALTDYDLKLFNPFYGNLFQTLRIPLQKFTGIDLKRFKALEVEFVAPAQGLAYLAHVRFSPGFSELSSDTQVPNLPRQPTRKKLLRSTSQKTAPAEQSQITAAEMVNPDVIAISFTSTRRFKTQNALPILTIEDKTFTVSKVRNSEAQSVITFYLPVHEFISIRDIESSFKITLMENPSEFWVFENNLNKVIPQ